MTGLVLCSAYPQVPHSRSPFLLQLNHHTSSRSRPLTLLTPLDPFLRLQMDPLHPTEVGEEAWDQYRDVIEGLYKNNTLEEVRTIMMREHNFHMT